MGEQTHYCENSKRTELFPIEECSCSDQQPPAPPKCGQPAKALIPRWGMYFACVLPNGHKGDHQPGGTCFRHGDYVGDKCPQWPNCEADPPSPPRRMAGQSMPIESRSVQRRKALQKGEPMPTFEPATPAREVARQLIAESHQTFIEGAQKTDLALTEHFEQALESYAQSREAAAMGKARLELLPHLLWAMGEAVPYVAILRPAENYELWMCPGCNEESAKKDALQHEKDCKYLAAVELVAQLEREAALKAQAGK
jgi:hypothetical protein